MEAHEETTAQSVVGWLAYCFFALFLLAPLENMFQVVKARSARDLPFPTHVLAAFLNCSFWVIFGWLSTNLTRVTIANSVGAVVMFVYVLIYLSYDSEDKPGIGMCFAFEIAVVGVAMVSFFPIQQAQSFQAMSVGLYCVMLGVFMYIAPANAIYEAWKDKDHSKISFMTCLAGFLNGGGWLLYAFLRSNVYSMISNGIGCMLGLIQIVLYVKYRYFTKKNPEAKKESSDITQRPLWRLNRPQI